MIISDTKKFVFIHIPKTAGMSVRHVLGAYATVGVWAHPFSIQQRNKELQKHVFARTAIKYVNKWNEYFTFAFVRNPWDWVVSIYFYIKRDRRDPRHKKIQSMNFNTFVIWMLKWDTYEFPIRGGQKNYIIDTVGNIIVNKIGRVEEFNKDFEEICKIINVPCVLVKKNITSHRHYNAYYNSHSKNLVKKMFAEDIEEFKYRY